VSSDRLCEGRVCVVTGAGRGLPIVDRSRENLSSSDVAVAHLRRMLLEALETAGAGGLPPGSALSPAGVRLPNASEKLVDEGDRWEDVALDPLTT
jgi:hypothetical protein